MNRIHLLTILFLKISWSYAAFAACEVEFNPSQSVLSFGKPVIFTGRIDNRDQRVEGLALAAVGDRVYFTNPLRGSLAGKIFSIKRSTLEERGFDVSQIARPEIGRQEVGECLSACVAVALHESSVFPWVRAQSPAQLRQFLTPVLHPFAAQVQRMNEASQAGAFFGGRAGPLRPIFSNSSLVQVPLAGSTLLFQGALLRASSSSQDLRSHLVSGGSAIVAVPVGPASQSEFNLDTGRWESARQTLEIADNFGMAHAFYAIGLVKTNDNLEWIVMLDPITGQVVLNNWQDVERVDYRNPRMWAFGMPRSIFFLLRSSN